MFHLFELSGLKFTHQWYRFGVLEFDICNALETLGLVACDQTNITYFANT